MDRIDIAILNRMQRNNQLSHAEIGDQIGLSASAVRRRLVQLRKEGIIERDVSILNPDFLGVTLIVRVSFSVESIEIYEKFEKQMLAEEEVRQCYHTAGGDDYTLFVNVPTLSYYEEWSMRLLMSNDNIRRYESVVVWSCKKFETALMLQD